MRRNLAASVFALSMIPLAASAGPPLSHYAIFAATDRVKIGAGSHVAFLPGAPTPIVGTGYKGTINPGVFLNGGALIQGDVRSASDVSLANGCAITGTVYHPAGTTVSLGSGSTTAGQLIGNPELPVLPAASPCASGGTNHTIANGQSLTLAPGSYGSIQLGGACHLSLSSGAYYLTKLTSGNGLRLNVDLSGGPLSVYVCGVSGEGYTDFGSVTTSIVAGPSDPNTASQMIKFEPQGASATGWSFEASGSSKWLGTVFSPNGSIHFGGGGCCSSWTGQFLAQGQVNLEHAVTGSLPTEISRIATWGRVKSMYR